MAGEGLKFDEDKLRWDLLPMECVEEVVRVLTMGANKYGSNNWQQVEPFEDRYYAAMMRHIVAWRNGEEADPESGLSHLSHAMCNVVFLLWNEKHKSKTYYTSYIYRYHLGPNALMDDKETYVVYHEGQRKEIGNNIVEFSMDKKINRDEFWEIVKGTQGITKIEGEFI